MDNIQEIYTNIIMEHSANSEHKHLLENEDCSLHGHNPNCGDDVTLHIKFDGDRIADLSFTGSGCAISQASTSVMIDILCGKTLDEAIKISNTFHKMILGAELTPEEESLLDEALAFSNVAKMPARVKCAMLPWKTISEKLDSIKK